MHSGDSCNVSGASSYALRQGCSNQTANSGLSGPPVRPSLLNAFCKIGASHLLHMKWAFCCRLHVGVNPRIVTGKTHMEPSIPTSATVNLPAACRGTVKTVSGFGALMQLITLNSHWNPWNKGFSGGRAPSGLLMFLPLTTRSQERFWFFFVS